MRTGRRNISEGGGNAEEISYLIDLTLPYRNMLSATERSTAGSALGRCSETLFLNDGITAEGIHAESGAREFYTCDEYGSPVRYTDENGNTTGLFGYDEYGLQTDLFAEAETRTYGTAGCNAVSNPLLETSGSRNRNENIFRPFTFTGYMEDEVSGLYFAQAREYDPESGRFAGKDWIKGFANRPYTLNEYGYCWNNPKKYEDKDGRIPTVVIGAAVGFVVGGVAEGVGQIIDGMAEGKSFIESVSDINVLAVVIQAGAGAAKGAIAGTGVGAVALAFSSGAIDAAASVATDMIAYDKEFDSGVAVKAATAGVTGAIGSSKLGTTVKVVLSGATAAASSVATDMIVEGEDFNSEVVLDALGAGGTNMALGFASAAFESGVKKLNLDTIKDVDYNNRHLKNAKIWNEVNISKKHQKQILRWRNGLRVSSFSYLANELTKGVGKKTIKKLPVITSIPAFNEPLSVS